MTGVILKGCATMRAKAKWRRKPLVFWRLCIENQRRQVIPNVSELKETMKNEHTILSSTPIISTSTLITSKEGDARARRCFAEQFSDLDGTSTWNIFRDISAPIFDLLVSEINRCAGQKIDH